MGLNPENQNGQTREEPKQAEIWINLSYAPMHTRNWSCTHCHFVLCWFILWHSCIQALVFVLVWLGKKCLHNRKVVRQVDTELWINYHVGYLAYILGPSWTGNPRQMLAGSSSKGTFQQLLSIQCDSVAVIEAHTPNFCIAASSSQIPLVPAVSAVPAFQVFHTFR